MAPMRKLVVLSFISLDGVMQAPGDPEEDTSGEFRYGGWTVPYADESMNAIMAMQMGVPLELLLGWVRTCDRRRRCPYKRTESRRQANAAGSWQRQTYSDADAA